MTQARGIGIEEVMARAVATGLFTSLLALESPSGVFNDGGQPDGLYNPVAGLEAIPCMDMPLGESRILASELKSLKDVLASAPRHVLLDKRYFEIEGGVSVGWRAVLTNVMQIAAGEPGVVYDVLGAECDSQRQMTRVSVALKAL
jgi:hypothetical protein